MVDVCVGVFLTIVGPLTDTTVGNDVDAATQTNPSVEASQDRLPWVVRPCRPGGVSKHMQTTRKNQLAHIYLHMHVHTNRPHILRGTPGDCQQNGNVVDASEQV